MITRYEIAAKHPDGRAFLIAYSPRLSRMGLLTAMQERGQAIINKCAIADDTMFGSFVAKPRAHVSAGSWWFGFTGRTQHDAKQLGELPYIAA